MLLELVSVWLFSNPKEKQSSLQPLMLRYSLLIKETALWFRLRRLLITLFPFLSFFCSIVHLLSVFNPRNTSRAVSPWLFLFPHEYIFWVKHFQFPLVSFGHLIQGGIWNTGAPVSYCLLCSLAHCDNRMWLSITPGATRTNLCASLWHIYTQKKASRQTGAHPLASVLTLLACCHLPKPHPPPTHFSRELQTSEREIFGAFSSKCCTPFIHC